MAAMLQVAPVYASGQGTEYQEIQGYFNASGCQTQGGIQVCATWVYGCLNASSQGLQCPYGHFMTTVSTQNGDVPTFTVVATLSGCGDGSTEYTMSQGTNHNSFCPVNAHTDPTITYSFTISRGSYGNLYGGGSGCDGGSGCADLLLCYGEMTSSSTDSGTAGQNNVDTLSWNSPTVVGVVFVYNLCVPGVFLSSSYVVTDTGGDYIGPVIIGSSGNANLNLVPETMTVTTTIDTSYVIFFGGF